MDNAGEMLLLHQFTETFARLDEAFRAPQELPGCSFEPWYIMPFSTDSVALEEVYTCLPARFPSLYEKLLLNFRWTRIELPLCRLHANPMDVDKSLKPFRESILADPRLAKTLLPAKLIPFALAPDVCYDPVCFDASNASSVETMPIIQLDHEEILYAGRIVPIQKVADSFLDLVKMTIRSAENSTL